MVRVHIAMTGRPFKFTESNIQHPARRPSTIGDGNEAHLGLETIKVNLRPISEWVISTVELWTYIVHRYFCTSKTPPVKNPIFLIALTKWEIQKTHRKQGKI